MSDKLVIVCPPNCSLRPGLIGPGPTAVLLAMRQNGAGAPSMTRRASEVMNRSVSETSMDRHLKHYKPVEDKPGSFIMPDKKLADLEILDLVIQRGAANSNSWKPSIKDTIEAMKLKMQMTGNSAFDDLIALLDGADSLDQPDEAVEAVLSADELPSEDSEELEAPLL